MPFFSDTYLPPERGTYASVTDFRSHRAAWNTSNAPNFFCVRLVWNGVHINQLCDPMEHGGSNRTTGVVRMAIEEFWNDLKRAHWVDHATRAMTITVPLSANNAGVRSRVTFMFEFVSAGSVLPSYDVQTRVTRLASVEKTFSFNWIAFVFTIFFCALEVFEICVNGIDGYFNDMWNVMDWLNYSIFFIVWGTLLKYKAQLDDVPCMRLCQEVGYQDSWEVMSTIRDGKFYLSLCVCIQLLKIIKFTSALIPKMDLAPLVLKRALADLIFFGLVFLISMLAFSTMFYIQLGPFLVDYATQEAALIGLSRALFGDFDIDEIMDNSSGYMNTLLFIIYLFVAVFIMLSMFFAILGERQAELRDAQREDKHAVPEYGVFSVASEQFTEKVLLNMHKVGDSIRARREEKRKADLESERSKGSRDVDRIEMRQLALDAKLSDMAKAIGGLSSGLRVVSERLDDMRRQRGSSSGGSGRHESFSRGGEMAGRHDTHGRRPDRVTSKGERERDMQGGGRSGRGDPHQRGGTKSGGEQLRPKGPKLVNDERRASRSADRKASANGNGGNVRNVRSQSRDKLKGGADPDDVYGNGYEA